MAGSGSRPLTNIPYCCLPQESGPCLSASVGDRPPRSPSHRRLGGPSPRRLSNGTHAPPPPPQLSSPRDAPKARHPASPRVSAGCTRAGGGLHTRYAPVRHCPGPPRGTRAVRLACIRPAASVHPEPGSNSSLYIVTLDSFPVHRIHLGPKLMVDFLTFQTFYAWLIASKNCRNHLIPNTTFPP